MAPILLCLKFHRFSSPSPCDPYRSNTFCRHPVKCIPIFVSCSMQKSLVQSALFPFIKLSLSVFIIQCDTSYVNLLSSVFMPIFIILFPFYYLLCPIHKKMHLPPKSTMHLNKILMKAGLFLFFIFIFRKIFLALFSKDVT